MRLPLRAALLATLAAGAPAAAQEYAAAEVRVAPLPVSAAAAPLHPAMLAAYAAPGGPFAGLLSAGAAKIASAARFGEPAAAAAPVLKAMAAGEPLERAAAGALARALSDPRDAAGLMIAAPELIYGDLPRLAGRRLPLGDAAPLAEAARRDPSLAFLFDGSRPPQAGAPNGAALDGEDLVAAGRRIAALGRGAFGLVHPHPEIEGAVIKTDLPRGARPEDLTPAGGLARRRIDRDTAEKAAAAGVGPRVLGEDYVGDRPALIKERVYGDTVANLLADGRFGPAEHALIEALFGTLAARGMIFFDVGPGNIMIGRTLGDPRVRAYLIDGGMLLPNRAGVSAEEAVEDLFGRLRQLAHPHELMRRFDAVHFGAHG